MFSVFARKKQRNHKTQSTNGRHRSQHSWNAEFTFQNRQNENTDRRSDFRYARGKAAGSGSQLCWKEDRWEREGGGIRAGVHEKVEHDEPGKYQRNVQSCDVPVLEPDSNRSWDRFQALPKCWRWSQ